MNFIDRFLNSITMYKAVLYGLQVIALASVLLSAFGVLHFSVISLIISFFVITTVAYFVNYVFSRGLEVPSNVESTSITSYILFLTLAPISAFTNNEIISWSDVGIVTLITAIAIASKYLLSYKDRHFFNPAAFGLVMAVLLGFGQATWWVANFAMFPIVLIVGLLIVRKIRRFDLFFSFVIAAAIPIIIGLGDSATLSSMTKEVFVTWPVIFFGTVMLTEPFTVPGRKVDRIIFGIIVGVLFGTPFQLGGIGSTPQLALIIGNIYTYFISKSYRMKLTLLKKEMLGPDIYEFSFAPQEKVEFLPGQYLEWTMAHDKPDSRGVRRYFTIASSPTEPEIKLGIKTAAQNGSSFKHSLVAMDPQESLIIDQLGGDFTLPEDTSKKLVFIAGGIGITPFRSMIKYLSDTKQKRDVVLFYAAQNEASLVYKNIFEEAEKAYGLKVVYVVSSDENLPQDWKGVVGRVTPEIIRHYVPDTTSRDYYISGPDGMVTAYKKMLHTLEVGNSHIHTDYFPGF